MTSLPRLDLQAARSATMRRPAAPLAFIDSSTVGGYAELTDTQLLDAARIGDGTAYAMLWERYRGTASRIARRYLPSHDADDAVSESFAQIWSTLLSGGGPTQSFGAYLAVSVRNIAGRFTTRNRSVPVDATEQSVLDQAVVDPDLVGDDLERDLAVAAFKTLSPRHQRALMLSIEQSTDQAADTLGVSRRGFTSLAYRARENLRRAYLSAYVEPAASAMVIEDECRQFRNDLGSHVRGGLRQAERQALETHLVTCVACDKVYQEVLELNATMPSPQRLSALAIPFVPILMGGWLAGMLGLGAKSAGAGTSTGSSGVGGGAAGGGGAFGTAGAAAGASGIAIGGAIVGVAAAVVAAAVILPGVLSNNDGDSQAGMGNSSAASGESGGDTDADSGDGGDGIEIPNEGDSGDSPANLVPPIVPGGGDESSNDVGGPGSLPSAGVPSASSNPDPLPSASTNPPTTPVGPSTGPTTKPPTTTPPTTTPPTTTPPTTTPPTTTPPTTTPPVEPEIIETWQMNETSSVTLARPVETESSNLVLNFKGKPGALYLVTMDMDTATEYSLSSAGSLCWAISTGGTPNVKQFFCTIVLNRDGVETINLVLPSSMKGKELVFDLRVRLSATEIPEHRFIVEKV